MELNGEQISLVQLAAVASGGEAVHITDLARPRILASRKTIEQIVERDAVVYGVNTGFGKLSDVRIPQTELRQLQLNLVRSHACGIGNPLSEPEARAMMVLRANVLALGFSGIRFEVIELLCEMLNRRVCPVVPEKGSVGASGDLAPLAHLALSLIGEGEAIFGGERISSVEALTGTPVAFDPRLQEARPHPGQKAAAEHLLWLVQGSEIRESHLTDDPRVQDAYSLR